MCYSELEAEKAKGARVERFTDTFSLAGDAGPGWRLLTWTWGPIHSVMEGLTMPKESVQKV